MKHVLGCVQTCAVFVGEVGIEWAVGGADGKRAEGTEISLG